MKLYFGGDGRYIDPPLVKAGVQYRLASYYYIEKKETNVSALADYRHVIIDSGLFSFMFGAGSDGETFDVARARVWMNQYVEWIRLGLLPGATFVEVDAQVLIGVDETWTLRHEFRELVGPDVDVMCVYHLPDGNPDRLIDFADYIAVGMPELRKALSPQERRRVVSYIATKAHRLGKRVHLLGTVETEYLRDFRFCTSCDTSCWLNTVRYGKMIVPEGPVVEYGKSLTGEDRYRTLEVTARGLLSLAQKYAGDQR